MNLRKYCTEILLLSNIAYAVSEQLTPLYSQNQHGGIYRVFDINQLLAYLNNTNTECIVPTKSFNQKYYGNRKLNVKHIISYKHELGENIIS